jgi:Protein of unknown function (DUF3352)
MLARMQWTPPAGPEPPAIDPVRSEAAPAPELSRPVDPPRPQLGRRILIGALTFVVVAGLVAGGVTAFHFFRGAGDRLASLAPDDTAMFVTVYLDPAGSQKLAVNGLLGKFPNVSTPSEFDSTVNHLLDQSLAESGLNHNDVRPWLGGQFGYLMSSQQTGGDFAQPQQAALVSSSDDSKALAALKKFEASTAGQRYTWSTQSHDGVNLDVGKSKDGNDLQVSAVFNGTFVFSNSPSLEDEIIDTAHGHHAALTGTSDYSNAVGQLPSDKLALFYLDVPRLSGRLSSGAVGGGVSPLGHIPTGLAQLSAYRGAGFAVSAQSDGVAIDGVLDFDGSKLSPANRAATQVSPDTNKTLQFVPAHAYGVYALTGLPQTIRSLLDALNSSGANRGGFGGFVNGFLDHLTGDAALEVDHLPGQSVPAGAVIVATDSDSSAKQLLDTAVRSLCGINGSCNATDTTTESYRGTTITTLNLRSDLHTFGVTPSWAVKDGMAILASSVQELQAVLDARAGGNVTGSPRFADVMHNTDASNNGLFYGDLKAIEAAVHTVLPDQIRAQYDSQVAQYLDHFTALGFTSTNSSDHTTFRSFIQVQ